MKIFGTKVAAFVHVLEYCDGRDFFYKEIDQIAQKDNRISFSVLMDLKYQSPPSEGTIGVDLIYIKDSPSDIDKTDPQKISYLPLWYQSIVEAHTDSENNELSSVSIGLRNDPWDFKHSIKLNFESVPVPGPGSYAIAMYAKEDDSESSNRKVLDCAYFKVNK